MSPPTCAFFLVFFGMNCLVTAILRAAALQPHIKKKRNQQPHVCLFIEGAPGPDKKVDKQQ